MIATDPLQRFQPSDLDEAWGLYVTAFGTCSELPPMEEGWRIVYLVRGAAQMKAEGGTQVLEAGHALVLGPMADVALQPDPQRGYRAHVVDLGGDLMARWVEAGFFGDLPVAVPVGFDESLLALLGKLAELSRLRPEEHVRHMSGVAGHLLARMEIAIRQGGSAGRREKLVLQARHLLADPERDHLCLESLAEELGVSYSWFRQSFRTQMGVSPQQFRLQTRVERACQMLADTQLSIGEIAEELGFSSQAYFSRLFRKETGLSPTLWRQNQVRRG